MTYEVFYLNARQGISKNNKPFNMMNILVTVKNGAKVEQSYTTSLFVNEEIYNFVAELTPMTKLDIVFVPTSRGVQIIQLDIAVDK